MKIKNWVIIMVLSISSCKKVNIDNLKANKNLIKELEIIHKNDQKTREFDFDYNKYDNSVNYRDSINNKHKLGAFKNSIDLFQMQAKIDAINKNKVETIIKNYGYPGLKTVGSPTNTYVWYVMMHQSKESLPKYLPIIKSAAKKGELENKYYCQMLDRVLMYQGKEQIYGTQGYSINIINEENENEYKSIIWPVKDIKNINLLRKKMGFEDSIEDYCKSLLGVKFENHTIQQIQNIENKNSNYDIDTK